MDWNTLNQALDNYDKEQELKKLKEDIEVLKRKLAQAKPELTEWIELHFGKVRE